MKEKQLWWNNAKIGERIKFLRLQKGWYQKTLADKAGLTQSCISLIESRKTNFYYDTSIDAIAKAFSVEKDIIIGK